MKSFFECWAETAAGLLTQALAGEPEFAEISVAPVGDDAFAFAANLSGDPQGRFLVVLSGALLETPLLGEQLDQKAAWGELLRETVEAAASESSSASGRRCRLESFTELAVEVALQGGADRAFELRSGERGWSILVRDELRAAVAGAQAGIEPKRWTAEDGERAVRPGLDLLLDVELEAALRFGSRELSLGEVLELEPGDVVPLDRHVSDPVDLIVADKIVARGEVVLVNGNFGLRVTEVASPRLRLESIRCLF